MAIKKIYDINLSHLRDIFGTIFQTHLINLHFVMYKSGLTPEINYL